MVVRALERRRGAVARNSTWFKKKKKMVVTVKDEPKDLKTL